MTKKALIVSSLILLLITLFGWLNLLDLRAEEPRRASVSIEMLLSGNYIVPQLNGWPYYNKPPLFNWIMVLFFKLFNSYSEWVVRLPGILSFLLLAFMNYRFTLKYVNKEVALLSSLFLLTSADILFYGTVNAGEIDLFYALTVYLQAIVIYGFFQKKAHLNLFIWSYLLVAIGLLTKGVPSLAFQAFTLIALAIYNKQYRFLFSWQHVLGLSLCGIIIGSYLYLYHQQENAFVFLINLFKEASQRSGLEAKVIKTLVQSVTFPLLLIQILLPWSLLSVYFFQKKFIKSLKQNTFISFTALFFISNILIYWISGTFKPRYYYMFFPFMCVLFAYYYDTNRLTLTRSHKVITTFFDSVAIIFPVIVTAAFFVLKLKSLPVNTLWAIIVILISVGVTFVYFKSKEKIYALVLLLAVARLAFNIYYLPATRQRMYYRKMMAKVLDITKKQPVYLYGLPYSFTSDVSIGPIKFTHATLTTAPLLAYQIPYYITRSNNHILEFEQEIKPGCFYIAPVNLIEKKYRILFRFEDKFGKQTMGLFKS